MLVVSCLSLATSFTRLSINHHDPNRTTVFASDVSFFLSFCPVSHLHSDRLVYIDAHLGSALIYGFTISDHYQTYQNPIIEPP